MYSYLMKGYTVGQTLTRRLFRTLFGIPGLIIDLLVGLFWTLPYQEYFNKVIWNSSTPYMTGAYTDGTRTSICRCVTGYPGDLFGYVIGSAIGILLAVPLFVVNSLLTVANWLIRESIKQTDIFSNYIGGTWLAGHFSVFENSDNYYKKAWNLGALILGSLLAAIPFTLCKGLEFFLPIGNHLSTFVLKALSLPCGAITGAVALGWYPVMYFLDKLCDLHDLICDTVLKLVAFVYAKTDQEPVKNLDPRKDCCSCLDNDTLHSQQFRKKVNEYKPLFASDILFNDPEKRAEAKPAPGIQ